MKIILVGETIVKEPWEQEALSASEVYLAIWPIWVSSPSKITTFLLPPYPAVIVIHVFGLRMGRFSAGELGIPVSMVRTRVRARWLCSIPLFSQLMIRRCFSLSDPITRNT